jgi:hypothetical protein
LKRVCATMRVAGRDPRCSAGQLELPAGPTPLPRCPSSCVKLQPPARARLPQRHARNLYGPGDSYHPENVRHPALIRRS